ncbi:MAG: discoidin domain-containing protein [Candidatus Aminicenantes bacterium]|nr:discoidin domain-containing protein [Candidatus Aminicenantes bacterium]MDH5384080.1 discoidin domain-containing protein [Candidatus Aminicenantes bacterium]MDH5742092.1 discoidin domain-containing protein [Candidatus Aminicenantes bacterium]
MIKRAFLSGVVLTIMILFLLDTGVSFQDQEKEVLELKLPKPMFVGTPRNIRSPNLEKITGKRRGPFYVPKGTEPLSLKKPVTGSDTEPVIGEIEFVTDGEKSGEEGYYVEFGPLVQWVQIDLEDSFLLHAILVWHYHSQARVYRDVIVQVSEDPDFITDVRTIFNNDHDNSTGLGVGKDKEYIETNEGRLIDPRGVKARYVRLYSRGNTSNEMNHYVEVEVYGTPSNE